ncbi:MAG: CHAT domain-containing protein [Candidatus Nanopelagicales bacterium]
MVQDDTAEDGEQLLRLALSRPGEAQSQAAEILTVDDDPLESSYARQALGIVLRDGGDLASAVPQLRAALRSARRTGRTERVADVRATLGAALAMGGATTPGLRQLDIASHEAGGTGLAKVLMRRAHVLSFLGRHEEAREDLRRALQGIQRSGDLVWEARTLNNRAEVEIALGSVARAERDVRRAEELFIAAGQDLEAVHTLHNRGVIAYLRGDLPRAFALFDAAAVRYQALGATHSDLVMDRCTALVAARLSHDAVDLAREALAGHDLQPRHRAEIQLMLATAALSHGDAPTAMQAARAARDAFRRQGRHRWVLRAELAVVRARYEGGARGAGLRRAAAQVAERLASARAEETPGALLLAGRLAAEHDPLAGDLYLGAAARFRRSPSSLVQATGWTAVALARQAEGDRRGVLRACGRGLDALDEHRSHLGDSELRALVTLHGQELAGIALGQVVAGGSARSMLRWSERWRATSLAQPSVRPPRDAELAGQLAAMRAAARRLDAARERNLPTAALEEDHARWEKAIRTRQLHVTGASDRARPLDVRALLERLGDTTFVELVEVAGRLHAVLLRRGRARRFEVGPMQDAVAACDRARFALRQAARLRPTELTGVAAQLESALLRPVAAALGEDPVVISPPSRLSAAPWGLLPALAGTPVSAMPSAAMWIRARAVPAPARTRMALIAGPGLASGGAEVAALARSNPQAVVLRGARATVAGCLAALDGVSIAHIAAHGRHRPQSPMFSSLILHDGPLTVHDFDGMGQPPYRLVLSACDSGVMAPVGSNELIGLAAALLGKGAAGVLCSVTAVNDDQTVALMLGVHEGLARGRSPAEVLLAAREAARGDVLRQATAASFVALGV